MVVVVVLVVVVAVLVVVVVVVVVAGYQFFEHLGTGQDYRPYLRERLSQVGCRTGCSTGVERRDGRFHAYEGFDPGTH